MSPKPGVYFPVKVEVLEGNVPCRVALRVMKDQYSNDPRVKGYKGWSCDGPEGIPRMREDPGAPSGNDQGIASVATHDGRPKVVQRKA